MNDRTIDARSERMLELLAQGASTRVVARKLGYSEGTMRVYLHNMYKLIGVRNKTEAVIWHLHRERVEPPPVAAPAAVLPALQTRECFGEMALAEDLYAALGVMSSFLGPHGHVWEAGVRLKGGQIDAALLARRMQSRLLWRALLQGDFAYGKSLFDEDGGERLLADSPSDAVLLACLLALGGYSHAADRLGANLANKHRGGPGMTAREASLLRCLRDAVQDRDDAPVAALHHLASESARSPVLRQTVMVALFHAYKAVRDFDRARGTAEALWAEAEGARQQLEAMGVRPLAREASLPRPARQGARDTQGAREKVAVTR
jgi:DNA-binding CsgD family transcriptional regulator